MRSGTDLQFTHGKYGHLISLCIRNDRRQLPWKITSGEQSGQQPKIQSNVGSSASVRTSVTRPASLIILRESIFAD